MKPTPPYDAPVEIQYRDRHSATPLRQTQELASAVRFTLAMPPELQGSVVVFWDGAPGWGTILSADDLREIAARPDFPHG